jgi:hypothetical protein
MLIVGFVLANSLAGNGRLAAGVVVLVLFGAAGAVGAAAGFLFGLPRSRVADLTGSQPDVTSSGAKADKPAEGTLSTSPVATYYLTNSNLIKVSDWLTTIIIGLGLVNLRQIGPAVRRLGSALKQPLGGAVYSGTIGVCVIIVGGLSAFLLAYLWTSIRVRELLEESERQSERDVVPLLEGATWGVAKDRISITSLNLKGPEDAPSDDANVEIQEPSAGVIVQRGSTVKVKIKPAAS